MTHKSGLVLSKALVGLVVVVLLGGCGLFPRATGRVTLSLGAGVGAKTILPTVTIASYLISFSGPGVVAPVSTAESNPTVDVEVGTWDISVEGKDSGGNTVAVGGASGVVVTAGATTSVSIMLGAQSSGNGAIDVTVSWPGTESVDEPVEVTLDAVVVDGGTLSSGSTWVRYVQDKPAGSYVLCFVLKKGGVRQASVQEAVQVYGNLSSTAAITLTAADFSHAPAAPTGLAVAEGLGKLLLSWVDNSSVETGYTIERGTDGVSYGAIDTISAPATSWQDTTAVTGQVYHYRVKAANDFGASDPSGSASGKVEAPVAGGGGALTFSAVSANSVRVTWQKATDNVSAQAALAYKVVRSESNNVQTVADAQANGTVVQDWTADITTVNATGLTAGTAYYFNVLVRDEPGNATPYASSPQPTSPSGVQIIADHTIVDRYDAIPQYWLDQVKKMWLDTPGESHSTGYMIGLQVLAQEDPRFAVNVTTSGAPEAPTSQHLRASRAVWGDVNNPTDWLYWYGEEDSFTSALAIERTKAHFAYCAAQGVPPSAFGFGWCWDMTWHNDPGGTLDPVYQVHWAGSSVGGPEGDLRWGLDAGDYSLTGNSVCMDTYLAAIEEYNSYCSVGGLPTRVFFTTGPVDEAGESGYQRELKHQWIRAFALADSGRVLFDYADILAWSNQGLENTRSWTDYGGTAQTYQYLHSDNNLDLDGEYRDDGDHIGTRGALRLAKALWWMLARMAGWSG